MRYDKILIVDLEATCFNTQEEKLQNVSEIIEIGVVLLNLKTQQIEKSQGIIVKPIRSVVSKFCTELTTLTQEDVDKGISFEEACAILVNDYNSQTTPWASYGNYDKKMFDSQCKNYYDLSSPMSEHHTNVKVLFALASKEHKAVGMDRALKALNIPLVGTHHRGVDDALNITKIFQHLLFKGK